LTQDSAGNLYGTTIQGGPLNNGTVFKISTAGVVSTLYSFTGSVSDGKFPYGRVFLDSSGNIYGHTSNTIFRLSSAGVINSVSLTINNTQLALSDGFTCDGAMVSCYFWSSGNIYKFSVATGTFSSFLALPSGSIPYVTELAFGPDGNIYAVDPDSVYKINLSSQNYTVLHTFLSSAAGGWFVNRGLAFDVSGNVYGTTSNGGLNNNGVVFMLSSAGVESKLYEFPLASATGIQPQNGVVRDTLGNLYGMALGGPAMAGVIYKVSSSGAYSVIHSFTSAADLGSIPQIPLTFSSGSGVFYGVGPTGGTSSQGAIFKFN
jgi:uncharacterized repeat protein (TIGR03803 family)